MRKRSSRLSVAALGAEGLEVRSLRTVGLATGLNVVENLGTISPAAAISGVGLTASIRAGGSVTFDLTPQRAGTYELLVKYTGDPLTLNATGPGGSSQITLGSAGTFTKVSLDLKAVTYSITASDPNVHGSGSFVDWELLLTSGVGQAPVLSTTLNTPATTIPLPSLSPASATTSVSSTPALTPASISTQAAASDSSTTGVVISGPIGQLKPFAPLTPVGPIVAEDLLGMSLASTNAIPTGLVLNLPAVNEVGDLDMPMQTMQATADEVAFDQQELAKAGWLNRLVGMLETTAGPRIEPPSVSLAKVNPNLDESAIDTRTEERATISPELIAGIAIGGAVLRHWRRNTKVLPSRKTQSMPTFTRNWTPNPSQDSPR